MGTIYEPIVMKRDTYEHDNADCLATEDQINNGKYFPKYGLTAIGLKRLNNLQFCIEDVIKNNIEGDLIETGIWRGGAVIFMKGLLNYYNQNHRIVYCADSFMGCPALIENMKQIIILIIIKNL